MKLRPKEFAQLALDLFIVPSQIKRQSLRIRSGFPIDRTVMLNWRHLIDVDAISLDPAPTCRSRYYATN
jgi:hypothetical protein